MKKIFLLFVLFSASIYLNGQSQKFFTRFGGYGHDIGYSVIQTLNGHYAVTGSTASFGNGNTDVYLAFVDSTGWVRWEKSYGGFNNDIGRSIIQLADSGFVIAGYSNSFGAGGYDMYVVRTDKAGTLIWQKTFGGSDWDFGYCVKASPAGDSLTICGNTYSFGYGKSDGYIVKTDINGNFKWQKTYGGPEDDDLKSFVITYNNTYAFTGSTQSMGDTKGDAWFLKTGLSGDFIMSKNFGNTNKKQYFNDLAEHPVSHNLVFCGGWDLAGDDTIFAYILYTDENGIQITDVKDSYKKINNEQFYSVAYGNRNDEFAYVRRQPNTSTDTRLEAMVMMLTPVFLSTFVSNAISKYGSIEDDELFEIANTRDKGFICVGYTKGNGANLSDVFLVKLDSMMSLSGNAVNINEISPTTSQNIILYPTVTSSRVNIKSDKVNQTIEITAYNSIGEIVFVKKSNSTAELDLTTLSSGIYYISLTTKDYSKTFKVIKTE